MQAMKAYKYKLKTNAELDVILLCDAKILIGGRGWAARRRNCLSNRGDQFTAHLRNRGEAALLFYGQTFLQRLIQPLHFRRFPGKVEWPAHHRGDQFLIRFSGEWPVAR